MALRAFARRLGVALSAVQRAITEGRVTAVTWNTKGHAQISDPVVARQQWQDHTRPRVVAGQNGHGRKASGLALATQRERDARAKLAELEYARKSRELVPARDVEVRWSARVVAARTTLLGLPTRAKQRLPHLTVKDLAELDTLVREALDELSQKEGGG